MAKKDKKNVQDKKQPPKQPYKNMSARRTVLFAGFGLALAGLVLLVLSCLFLFVKGFTIKSGNPSTVIIVLYAATVAVSFIATVLVVAGANTSKGVARLGMFISSMTFIIGTAMLLIVLLFKTVLPLEALGKLFPAEESLLPFNL